jgi:hypothetical protein
VDSAEGGDALLRIERGQATEEELAAVAVTLFSLVAGQAAGQEEESGEQGAASWHRPQAGGGYRAPHSWR